MCRKAGGGVATDDFGASVRGACSGFDSRRLSTTPPYPAILSLPSAWKVSLELAGDALSSSLQISERVRDLVDTPDLVTRDGRLCVGHRGLSHDIDLRSYEFSNCYWKTPSERAQTASFDRVSRTCKRSLLNAWVLLTRTT